MASHTDRLLPSDPASQMPLTQLSQPTHVHYPCPKICHLWTLYHLPGTPLTLVHEYCVHFSWKPKWRHAAEEQANSPRYGWIELNGEFMHIYVEPYLIHTVILSRCFYLAHSPVHYCHNHCTWTKPLTHLVGCFHRS